MPQTVKHQDLAWKSLSVPRFQMPLKKNVQVIRNPMPKPNVPGRPIGHRSFFHDDAP